MVKLTLADVERSLPLIGWSERFWWLDGVLKKLQSLVDSILFGLPMPGRFPWWTLHDFGGLEACQVCMDNKRAADFQTSFADVTRPKIPRLQF